MKKKDGKMEWAQICAARVWQFSSSSFCIFCFKLYERWRWSYNSIKIIDVVEFCCTCLWFDWGLSVVLVFLKVVRVMDFFDGFWVGGNTTRVTRAPYLSYMFMLVKETSKKETELCLSRYVSYLVFVFFFVIITSTISSVVILRGFWNFVYF